MSDSRDYDRQLRNEYVEGRLLDAEDQAAYEASRNVDLGLDCGWVSDAEMQARWAAERAEVMAACPDGYEWRRYSLEASQQQQEGNAA